MTIHELQEELNGTAWFHYEDGDYDTYPPEPIENTCVIYTDIEDDNSHYFELSNGVWGHIYL